MKETLAERSPLICRSSFRKETSDFHVDQQVQKETRSLKKSKGSERNRGAFLSSFQSPRGQRGLNCVSRDPKFMQNGSCKIASIYDIIRHSESQIAGCSSHLVAQSVDISMPPKKPCFQSFFLVSTLIFHEPEGRLEKSSVSVDQPRSMESESQTGRRIPESAYEYRRIARSTRGSTLWLAFRVGWHALK